jgi:molybdopterin synthase catalytic subunit
LITLTDIPFSPAEALARFQAQAEGSGAIVSFTGLVRNMASDKTISTLHLQAYSPMTERGMQAALEEALTRWSLNRAQIIHRTGDIAPAEPIVFVATASAHRREAFEAADFLMDYLKTEAVFWKKEVTSDGERWIEPRTQDYRDNARWKNDKTETA